MNFEIIAMTSALILMFAAVGAKVLTNQLLTKLKDRINHVGREKQKILNKLKTNNAQKKVAQKNKAVLIAKTEKLARKKKAILKEIAQYKEEDSKKQEKVDKVKGKLI